MLLITRLLRETCNRPVAKRLTISRIRVYVCMPKRGLKLNSELKEFEQYTDRSEKISIRINFRENKKNLKGHRSDYFSLSESLR